MRILCTNDDGIHAPGLKVVEEIARALSDDVWVVAPETDQSGVSHSLSLNDPLRLRAIGERRFAVKGTPTDCVIMGAKHILKDHPPDLVLAGVNRGRNAGEDVIYSDCAPGDVKGIAVSAQGRNRQERLQIDQRQDGRGNAYYWITYVRMRGMPPADGSDISALFDNRIAVTPLRLDMTDEPFMTKLAELFGE